ncbi:MAG: hypothetical protein ACRDJE_17285, partial [Dehalococcoidia bacterium]
MQRLIGRVSWPWLLTGIVLGILAMWLWSLLPPRNADDEALDVFRDAYALTRDRFVDEDETQPDELIYDAIRGMVEGLGDTGHSRFLTPEQRKQQEQSLAGTIVGIGVQMT